MTILEQRLLEIMPKALHELAEQSKRIADALEERNRLLTQEKPTVTQAPEIVQTPRFSETAYVQ